MSHSEIVKALYSKINSSLRVSMPAIVESYDFKQQRASLKINTKELFSDGSYLDYPVISNVPVIFPASGGASLTMPVKRGDGCLLVFADRDIANWLLGANNAKPNSRRVHHISDAIAIIGLSPFNKVSNAKNNTDVLLHYEESDIRLKPKGIVDIESAKEINIKTENVIINCKNAQIKAEENIQAKCKSLDVVATEDAKIKAKNAILEADENVNAQCKNATLTVKENSQINCSTATLKASSNINTETPMFTQKGGMKIEGNIEVTGTSELKGNTTCSATLEGSTVKTSGGINLKTHTHSYIDSVGEAATPVNKTTGGAT